VSFSKVITKKWKSHLEVKSHIEVWVINRHLHERLLEKTMFKCVAFAFIISIEA